MNRKLTLLAGIAVFAISAATEQGTVLRRELKPNVSEVYSVETVLKQVLTIPSMGDQDIDLTSTMKMTLKTGTIDPATGQAAVDSTISEIKNKSEGMLAQMLEQQADQIPKEIKSTGKLDARNRLVLAPSKGGGGMMEMLLGASSPTSAFMFVGFPEKAVNVGDTWPVELPKSPMFGKEAPILTAKLTGEKEGNWVISVSGTIKIDADITEMLKNAPGIGGQKGYVKGTMDLTGEALVDKATGKTQVYTTKSKAQTKMDLPDSGMSIDTAGTTTTTIKLQK
jgi:hypothetical protein